MNSRAKAFWNGLLRGARFGAIAGLCVGLSLEGAIAVLVPKIREKTLEDIQSKGVLGYVGGSLVPLALMAISGSFPGAIIMGLAEMFRANRHEP